MDLTVDVQHPAPARRWHRVPWSRRALAQALSVAGGIPVQATPVLVPVLIVAIGRQWALWAWPWWPATFADVAAVFLLVPVLTRVHRHRLRAATWVVIPPQPRWPGWPGPQGIAAAIRSQATWRQAAYHFLAAPAIAAAAVVAIGVWLASLLFAFEYLYAWGLQPDALLRRATYPAGPPGLVDLGNMPTGVWLTLAGVAGLVAAPWLTSWVQELDVRASRALLGPSRAEELEHRVEHLTQTRAGVVDAADAERRRLERDLHDGTQQRLVSLAMNLGMARAQAATAQEARQAIAEAHEEAKAALAELRDLIRGLHPAVLEDRGLDAALSGIVARMPVPVRLSTDLTRRPAPVIEAVAYFVVSEGLANIAKHAQASQAEVIVQRAGDRLHVIVTDDGVGGADPSRGSGLAGLKKRAESVDGTFDISSPPGGPTLLTVDLPCAR